jgi:hypothetical protein
MWAIHIVHEQGDTDVFGRQRGPEQGVEQGRSAAVVPLIHHTTTRVRNKIQEYVGDPEVFGRQLGPEQRVQQGLGSAVVPLIHHPTMRVRNKIHEYVGEVLRP